MAFKDPPKDKSMNAPACSTVLLVGLLIVGALIALVGSPEGWWA